MRLALLLAFTFVIAACGREAPQEETFSKASADCAGEVAKGRYLVNWQDGRMTLELAESDEKFVSDFVKPNKEQIRFAENDFIVKLKRNSDSDQISAENQTTNNADNWGPAKVHADVLWRLGARGAGITVAVIDTGADINHPQLANRIATNPGEAGHLANNGIDDDGNGFVDDYAGYDFVHGEGLTGDNQFHGTHVSGIIAASHNDVTAQPNNYVEGIAPEAKILPLAFLDSQGSGNIESAVRAIDYAVKRGARVINASWGGSQCSRSLRDKISSLSVTGIIFVAAAGNSSANIDRNKEFPASFDLFSQITVGSTTSSDFMADHSNYGEQNVHIFAPGSGIVSTFPDGQMAALTGTSMATPFVAGAIALLLSAEPTASTEQIRQALYQSARHYDGYLNASRGRLDLATALSTLRTLMNP